MRQFLVLEVDLDHADNGAPRQPRNRKAYAVFDSGAQQFGQLLCLTKQYAASNLKQMLYGPGVWVLTCCVIRERDREGETLNIAAYFNLAGIHGRQVGSMFPGET
jgi:hypothetical protein